MDDLRLAAAIRRVRQAHGWRQRDLADRSGISKSVISRLECSQVRSQSVETIRAVASALEMRIDLVPRWRDGDLDRVLNRAHSALHESVARTLKTRWSAWTLAPEVTFAVYGERGSIDVLGWHAGRPALLVIELKTELVDFNELLATLDRKRRLSRRIAAERGWDPLTVSAWLIVSDRRTNRRRLETHRVMVGSALPDDGRTIHRWLRDPVGSVAALSFWTDSRTEGLGQAPRPVRRVNGTAPSVGGETTA